MTVAHFPRIECCRDREHGFTLMELLVTMLIIGILISAGVYSIRSARTSGEFTSALASAHAYADSVDAYAREHGDRYPTFPSAQWPADSADNGPIDLRISSMPHQYLRRVPENVQAKSVLFAATPDATKPTIVYVSENQGTGYRIEVHVPSSESSTCAIRGGNATSSSPKDCSGR